MINRRSFLKSSTLAPLAAGLAPGLLWAGSSAASGSKPSVAAFADEQGSWLELRDEEAYHVRLLEVAEAPADPVLEQFRLALRGPANEQVPEGVYEVSLTSGETHQLYVQPSGSDADGNLYQSSISVFRDPVTVPEPTFGVPVLAGLALLLGLARRKDTL